MRGSIHAFEGPAGSGKGFHLSRYRDALADDGGAVFLHRPALPRDLGPAVGAWSSSYLEYMAISAATMMPEKRFYVDRFLLSRWVYKAIEDGGRLDPQFEFHLEGSFLNMCTMARAEYLRRVGPQSPVALRPYVSIYVLLPNLDGLVERRRMAMAESGRTYPFSPAAELDLYREAAHRADKAVGWMLDLEIVEDVALVGA